MPLPLSGKRHVQPGRPAVMFCQQQLRADSGGCRPGGETVGSAQLWRQGQLLQHGSVQLDLVPVSSGRRFSAAGSTPARSPGPLSDACNWPEHLRASLKGS